jgi:hypothetical protein
LEKEEGHNEYGMFPYFTYCSGALLGRKGDSVTNTCGGSCPETRRTDPGIQSYREAADEESRDWILGEPGGSRRLDPGTTGSAPWILWDLSGTKVYIIEAISIVDRSFVLNSNSISYILVTV